MILSKIVPQCLFARFVLVQDLVLGILRFCQKEKKTPQAPQDVREAPRLLKAAGRTPLHKYCGTGRVLGRKVKRGGKKTHIVRQATCIIGWRKCWIKEVWIIPNFEGVKQKSSEQDSLLCCRFQSLPNSSPGCSYWKVCSQWERFLWSLFRPVSEITYFISVRLLSKSCGRKSGKESFQSCASSFCGSSPYFF